jgi:TonB family protein
MNHVKKGTLRFKLITAALFLIVLTLSAGLVNGCFSDNSNKNQPLNTQGNENLSKPLTVAEQMPAFQGGNEELGNYISKAVKYPEIAKRAGIQGKVLVSFVVSKDGIVKDVKLEKGIGSGCDEMAVEAVKKMPTWIPGKDKGAAVDVKMTLPISFALSK